jgi:putative inorganic carbon (HCO3(-)) transporter
MAAKSGKRNRSSATRASAAEAVSSRKRPSPRPHGDWVAPAIYGVFFLFLFLACSPALDSKFSLPKAIVLSAGVLALGILLIVRNWRGRGVAPPRSALLLSLALGAWWIVSTVFALHLPTALDGVYDYYNGLWTHLCWLALFVATMCIPSDLTTVRRIAVFLTAAIVPAAVVNIAETTGLSSLGLKEVSTLGDRVAASALMNFAIPFTAIALVTVRHWGVKAGMGGLLALLLISEFLSQGRGPWMGLVAAAVILAVGLIRSKAGWKVVGAMSLGMVLLAGLAAKLSPTVAERFATLTQIGHDESLGQRFVFYRAALRAIREHPVAGIGFENFRNAYPSYRSAEDIYFFDNVIPTMVHDGYLQTAMTNGMPALLLYLALVAGVLIKLVRELSHGESRDRHNLLLGFLAALSAYLVQDLVGWLDMATTSAFWIMLGLGLNLASQNTPRSSRSWTKPVIPILSGLMVLLSLYLLNDRYARVIADAHLFKAQALDVRTQWPDAELLVNKAVSSLPGDSRTEMVAGQIYADRFVSLHDPRAYARSRELLESSFNHNRYDRLRLVNIVALESAALELGQISKASDFAQEAITVLSETDRDNPGFHEFKAKFFAAQGRFGDALTAIREARRLAPQEQRFRSREAEYEAKLK